MPDSTPERSDPQKPKQENPLLVEWPRLLEIATSRGIPALVAELEVLSDRVTRRGLFALAFSKLAKEEWPGRSLDATIEIGQATIAEGLRQAADEDDPVEAGLRVDYANVISYNLAAQLADCWPEDDRPREPRHFQVGLAAAEDCLEWREQLGKGPGSFSIAYWAHGMHALSLGQCAAATQSFERSLRAAQEAASDETRASEPGAEATFGVNLGFGYLGLARMRAGDPEGKLQFESALAGFEAQKEKHPEEVLDVDFGIAQLHTAEARTRSGG